MTFEEMQRAMEFVVQQQAQTEANMARFEASMTRLETNLSREREQRIHYDQQFAQWMSKITDLLVLQSKRLDSAHEQQLLAQEQHLQTLVRLDRILEILVRKG